MSLRTAKAPSNARPTIGFVGDENTGIHSPAADTVSIVLGGTETVRYSPTQRGVQVQTLAITGGAGSTGVFASLANPFGADVIIQDSWLVIGTQSTGASTLDIGVAANGTTSSDTIIDGLSGAAAGLFNTRGVNGAALRRWNANQFVNVAEASGDVNGLVATLYLTVVRV